MGAQPPFLYNAVGNDSPANSFSNFDPKAVSRASLAPRAPRPKQEGPYISFNQHPDSYLIIPYGNTNAKPMNPSTKKRVMQTRIALLVFRILELLGAIGLLVMLVIVTKVPSATGWIIRIPPGFAILHNVYSVYHLGRRPSGRTPASSASYMMFASAADVCLIPFFVFDALLAASQYTLSLQGNGKDGEWSTLLASGQDELPIFSRAIFLTAIVSGGLHLVSLSLCLWLAVTFRKITKLPPDMNPLEDNLTSRHKRNKSSMSTVSAVSANRITEPLESKRRSGAPYEDLSRPPTIPFLQTRTGSVESFSTYHTTPPGSRGSYDSRNNLPSRQYQAEAARQAKSGSTTELKRQSGYMNPSSATQARYTELSPSDEMPSRYSRQSRDMGDAWFADKSITDYTEPRSLTSPKKREDYQPLHQRQNSEDEPIHPLRANPPAQRGGNRGIRTSALSEVSLNRFNGDIADMPRSQGPENVLPRRPENDFVARQYGELKPGTPPIMVGKQRQVSSGNAYGEKSSPEKQRRRDVSGKVAEEGRGGQNGKGWGTRFRKISGL